MINKGVRLVRRIVFSNNYVLCILQEIEVNAMVLSAQFWPAFREEKIKLPEVMQKSLEEYTKKFEALKGNRTLNWKPHLGKNIQELSTSAYLCCLLIFDQFTVLKCMYIVHRHANFYFSEK